MKSDPLHDTAITDLFLRARSLVAAATVFAVNASPIDPAGRRPSLFTIHHSFSRPKTS
jgi:hypothetical protein